MAETRMDKTTRLNAKQWREQGEWFEYNGQRLFYRATEGVSASRSQQVLEKSSEKSFKQRSDKPVLLLIHGFPTSSWDWAPLWDSLAQRFEVVAMDMLGFGYSDKPDVSYSIMHQADLQEALLQHLGVSEFHILAHDYGDTVAQELLTRALQTDASTPRMLQSVVFSNGGLFPETHHPVLIQKLLLSPAGSIIARFANFKKFKANFDHICAKPLLQEELAQHWALVQENGGRSIMHRLIRYMIERKQHRTRWVGALQQSPVPIHLVDGVLDPISGEHMVQRFEELVPDATVTRLAGTGHYPQVESPEAFLAACESFWHSLGRFE